MATLPSLVLALVDNLQSKHQTVSFFPFYFLSLCHFLFFSFVAVLSASSPFTTLTLTPTRSLPDTANAYPETGFSLIQLPIIRSVLFYVFFKSLGRESLQFQPSFFARSTRLLRSHSTPSTSRFAPSIAPPAPGSRSARQPPLPEWRRLQLSEPWALPLP